MSTISEIRGAMAASNETAGYVRGALHQAGLDVDQIVAQLSHVAADSNQAAVQEALGVYQQIKDDLEALQGRINHATDLIEQYSAQL